MAMSWFPTPRRWLITVGSAALAVSLGVPAAHPGAAVPVQASWIGIGPDGGEVTALAIDSQTTTTLYAGTRGGGVFRTMNGGRTWRADNVGLRDAVLTVDRDWSVTALAIDPRTPATVYAATEGHGLFKSTDGGSTWGTSGLVGQVTALAIAPSATNIVYAGTSRNGVYRSTDGGQTWRSMVSGLPFRPGPGRFGRGGPSEYPRINTLAVHPQSPTTVHAGLAQGTGGAAHPEGGIFRSTDGGFTWRAAGSALDDPGGRCCPLAIDKDTPTTLYAGTQHGIFRSLDAGESWHPVNDGLAHTRVVALTADPQRPATLFTCVAHPDADSGCHLFKTTNRGGAWRLVSVGLTRFQLRALLIDPRDPTVLYAGTAAGILKSTDGGTRWVAASSGLSTYDILSVVVDPKTPGILYGRTDRTLFKSANGGRTWRRLDVGEAGPHLSGLAIDPRTPTTLYLGTAGTLDAAGRGVFKSVDGGLTWRTVTTGLTSLSLSVSALAIDPRTPTTIYAALRRRPGQVPESDAGVLKSIDGGETWRFTWIGSRDSSIVGLVVDPQVPTTIYAAAGAGPRPDSKGGILKSTDAGETWRTLTTPLDGLAPSSLILDPLQPGTLYLGSQGGPFSEGGVHKSIDGGLTWSPAGPGLIDPEVTSLALSPGMLNVVYAGTRRGGVFRSTDGGRSWHALNTGLANLRINAVVTDPRDADTVYVSTEGNGIFVLRR